MDTVKTEHIERADCMPALRTVVSQQEIELDRHIVRGLSQQEYYQEAGGNTDKMDATVDSRGGTPARALGLWFGWTPADRGNVVDDTEHVLADEGRPQVSPHPRIG